jgi:hypothetical protein
MNSAPQKQPGFILELRAVPGPWLAGPEQRLRALLKATLRCWGFRAVAVRPVDPAAQGGQPATGPAQAVESGHSETERTTP